ncbi:CotH kinase family protein [Vallitalea pronyensis]|uniref:CotH kinase family protein n=1 Tax=Vallitalea pronyensis TaxID=1348613 RepID=A0A8J8MHG6_9FIRM|nr:CotH kinase family protein [Vallitalea pronyensis]QUI21679.1 CotH kinase family protein [Vallitalea pronyensis]
MKGRNIIPIILSAIAIIMLLLIVDAVTVSSQLIDTNNNLIDQEVFPHDRVIDVKITIDEEDYTYMVEHAMEEEYVVADIDYNGYQYQDVGIRPKGNSSLKHVASSNDETKRFSLKVNFDYYVDEQNLYGISKINLNNIFSDPSMMAEYLSYDMLDTLGAEASRTTYAALYINDVYFGLYLAVEQVDESFLEDRFGNATGELYKPEMGAGSDLKYISDDPDDYSLEVENGVSTNDKAIINFMKVIQEGSDLETVLHVDSFLKYLAVSTVTVHLDAYQGGMYHNYYLYHHNGRFEWITWDLNMSFNGFPKGGTDEQAVAFLIDEPVSGAMDNYPLIKAIFDNEAYMERYHGYITTLLNDYLDEHTITNKVTNTYEMIKEYVRTDTTAFYTFEEFEEAVFSDTDLVNYGLLDFIDKRVSNVRQQLDGTIPSTNNGQGNAGGKNNRGGKAGGPPMGQDGQGKPLMGQRQDGENPQADADGNPMKNRGNKAMKPNMQDGSIPEDMKTDRMQQGMNPDKMQEGMDPNRMPEGRSPQDMKNKFPEGMPGNMHEQEEAMDETTFFVNLGLICAGILGMFIFIRIIKKK